MLTGLLFIYLSVGQSFQYFHICSDGGQRRYGNISTVHGADIYAQIVPLLFLYNTDYGIHTVSVAYELVSVIGSALSGKKKALMPFGDIYVIQIVYIEKLI